MDIKINSIQYREKDGTNEFIMWEPNFYYGKEQEYKEKRYKTDEYGVMTSPCGHHTIHPSCFKKEKACYTIARITEDGDLLTVGSRLLDLNKKDRKDFFKVYKLAAKRK